MRAVAVSQLGAAPELVELPAPKPGPGEILVRLHAAGMNPADWKIADGAIGGDLPHKFPMILGNDAAGTVDALGEGVSRFTPGYRVYGQFMRMAQGLGGYAEYGVVAVDGTVAPIPESMSFTQAAAIPTASTTAYNLVDETRIGAGQTVLVVGATGGVGRSVVQFAAARDATVIATATPDAAADLERLGAGHIVDPTGGSVREQVAKTYPDGIDTLIDLVSNATALESLSGLVRSAGTVATTNFTADPGKLAAVGIRGINLENSPSGPLLERLNSLFSDGRFTVDIEREVPFEDAPQALARLRTGNARGKSVIVM